MQHCCLSARKVPMLELYYDFLDQYLDWCDFELIQMDIDSMSIAILGEFDEIVRPELRFQYNNGGRTKFISTSKYQDRMPGLFKAEFQGTRMIALMSKCYYTEDTKSTSFAKISCKGVRKKQNSMF